MIHHEFERLVRRINDQWVPVEALDNNHILDAKLITWQTLLFPVQSLTWLAQKLTELKIVSNLQADHFNFVAPFGVKHLSVVMVEETNVSEES